jgi:hypothetical protein
MKRISTWFDVLENGTRNIFKRDEFQQAINDLKPSRYLYYIEEVEDVRSNEQNNTLFGLAYMYIEPKLVDMGIFEKASKSKLPIHYWCLNHFAPPDFVMRIREEWENEPEFVNMITGESFKEPFRISSKKMTKAEAAEYFKIMQDYYAENFSSGEKDLIPDPNPAKRRKH